MREYISCLLLLIVACQYLASQQPVKSANESNTALEASIAVSTLSTNNYRSKALTYDNVKGSPYLNKEPLRGSLTLLDGGNTEEAKLQYNIYTNEFLFIEEDGTEQLLEMKRCVELNMKTKEENFIFKRADPTQPHKFFDIIYEGEDLKIYNDIEVKFFEGKDQGITKIEPRFSKYDNLYFKKKGENPQKIKVKKKDILKLFEKDKAKQLEQTAKKNKIKLKKVNDFKKLFSAYKN